MNSQTRSRSSHLIQGEAVAQLRQDAAHSCHPRGHLRATLQAIVTGGR